ncbi:MAG: hypothetical protein RJA09_1649 [Pseudomonadota bacterium]|jgi:predicted metalloprotease with PDZ domain
MALHYTVGVSDPHTHLFNITLTIPQPARCQTVSLPVWIPGSYMVREFAQHLQHLQAFADGVPTACEQRNKNTWDVSTPEGCASLELRYQVYAFDTSVRTAYLDQTRAFFNPTSLCLRTWGHEHTPHTLDLQPPLHMTDWAVATGLPADPSTPGRYRAEVGYDQLADSPFTWAPFWEGRFDACGVPHRFVVTGAGPGFDGDRLLRNTQRICEAQIRFWHAGGERPPFDSYTFMLHASADGYGGLEHTNSTVLVCTRGDLPQRTVDGGAAAPLKASDGYTTLLGLISHEYFHTWNVKRLRPHEFARYDYERENHTELLWFFEGFTSYYDDLFLHRVGLIDTATYLQLVAKTVNQVLQTPGRHVQSVAQASFDAWTKYYRVTENTPNQTVSYYTKGALVALCLDLTLRLEGHATLDAVMCDLYQVCKAGPMTERQLLDSLARWGQRPYDPEIQAWVHGTADLPLASLLQRAGLQWAQESAPLAQRLGVRVGEAGGALTIKGVLRGSPAEAAGFAAGDEWLGVGATTPPTGNAPSLGWRVRKLDDVAAAAQGHTELRTLTARDGQLLEGRLVWPADTPSLVVVRPPAAEVATGVWRAWLHQP